MWLKLLFKKKVKISNSTAQALFSSPSNDNVDVLGLTRSDFVFSSRTISIELSDGQTGRWLIAVESPTEFAVSVVACWMAKKIPVISADLQPENLQALSETVDGVICDMDLSFCCIPVVCPSIRCSQERTWLNPQFDPAVVALELFTSGTTGQKKRFPKSFAALFAEIDNLERTFGSLVGGVKRYTTVSHFHIYGFLFNILWPLRFGYPLSTATMFYWEQIFTTCVGAACVISSPAHLRVFESIATQYECEWSKMTIFSSGGPLRRDIALSVANVVEQAPIEVLGSTETGGIAWRRQQSQIDSPFVPFEPVEVQSTTEGGLEVRSPWTDSQLSWWTTGDLISLASNGHFFLRGRYDAIVKIAGKRVSLSEMEQHVMKLDGIYAARIFPLDDESISPRMMLAAVIACSQSNSLLYKGDRVAFIKMLKEHMNQRFDWVTLPRFWRFVKEIPLNNQGKTTLQMLQEIVRNG